MAERYTRRINLYINGKEVRNDIKSISGEMGRLTNEQRRMTIGSDEYNRSAANIRRLKGMISEHHAGLRATTSLWQKTAGIFKTMLPIFSAGAIVAGLGKFVSKMKEAAEAADNFEERLDNLSALTGLEGSELEKLGDIAKKTSVKITEGGVRIKQSADDIVDAYTKVGSQRPELLKNAEALAAVTEDAIILSEAAKSDLAPAVAGLTTTMNQFNLGAGESRRIINAMAAGSKEGAADIPYLTEAIEKSGTTMNLMNISLEENIGLIEAIAPNYAEASVAGNSLDKVFLRLKEKNIGFVNGTFSVNAALDELAKRYKSGESAASIFGEGHAKMGELLVLNKDEFNRYTKAVTGTNVAIEQAAKNTNNAKAIQAQARNEWHIAAVELGQNLSPAMVALYKAAGLVASAFSKMIAASPVESLKKEQNEVNALVVELTNLNTSEEQRRKILVELEKISPKIVKGLSAENIETGKLKDNLRLYNEELAKRIVLANLSGDEEKEAARVAKHMENVAGLQWDINQIIKKTDEDIALSNITLDEKIKKTTDILKAQKDAEKNYGQLNVYGGQVDDLTSFLALTEMLTKSQGKLNDATASQTDFASRIKGMKELLGLTVTAPTPTTDPAIGSLKTVGDEVFEWDGKTWKFKEKVGAGGGGAETPDISAPDYAAMLAPDTDDPKALDWIMRGARQEAEALAQKKASEEEWTAFLKKQIEERSAAELQALQIEDEIADARIALKEMQVDAIGQLASALAGMFEQGSAAQIAMIAIEKAIAIAQIWISYAKESAAIHAASALMGPPGIAYDIVMQAKAKTQAAINTGIVVAQAVATGVSMKSRNKKEGYATGKYPGLQTGEYGDKPHYALFNEVPGQPETVIDGLTARNIKINYPGIMEAIYAVRDGRAPQYATGKYATPATPNSPPPGGAPGGRGGGIGPKTAENLTRAIDRLMEWEPEMVITDVKRRLDRLERINEQSKLK